MAMQTRTCPACKKQKKYRTDVKTCGCQGTNPRLGARVIEPAAAKPLTAGTVSGVVAQAATLPAKGKVKRFIVTAAQNNTFVHDPTWKNILALAMHYNAEIFVGRLSYNKGAYGPASVKPGTYSGGSNEPWYDPKLVPYFNDNRVKLGAGLVWVGDVQIIPTASDPLSNLETFSHRDSSIFPHTKIALRSIASLQGSGAKLNYTTGTVTQRNYIHMKAGAVAEFHHAYGALIVEVDSEGIWKVRQLNASEDSGTIYDLTLKIENGVVTDGHRIEAFIPGDIHATAIDPMVLQLAATGRQNMIDVLRPKFIVIHDLLEGASVNHHAADQPLERYKTENRGLTAIQSELQATADTLRKYHRDFSELKIVNSNHNRWLDRWLDTRDTSKIDARNLKMFFDGNYARILAADKHEHLNVLEYLMRKYTDFTLPAEFLGLNQTLLLCGKKLEAGMHGDFGANGSRGGPKQLAKIGRKAITAHSHVTGIYDGLYVAGTSTQFDMGYNNGPSSWSHSHVIVYENGKRAIITMFKDAWKA